MKIIDTKYNWNGVLAQRVATKYIILHHRGGNGDAMSIHRTHLANGWSGIGYHFYVRKDGSVYSGRPINRVGAHCTGYNNYSIGICFEGNYETEKDMHDAQKKTGQELVSYLKGIYPNAEVKGHRDFMATACPGRYFPFEEIAKGAASVKKELKSANDIVWELANKGIITDKELWLEKLKNDVNSYWLARKCVNYIREKNL